MATLWQTLLHPDLDDNPDRSLIASAANILEVGEFQLLQLAFRHWFDRDMTETEQNDYFASYVLRGEITHWMRHYARDIINQDRQHQVDVHDPAYHVYDPDGGLAPPRSLIRFIIASTLVLAVVFVLILLADSIVDNPGSLFPPYFGVTRP